MTGAIACTPKQHEIMDLVLRAADAGELLDIAELKERLSYGPDVTKQALQCSIRFLEKHGMLARDYERRRGARRMVLQPTGLAYSTFRGSV